ncbi:MAG: hypothetical protein H7Y01_07640 [Ferruginibacter sp.]|nr:hypothetical protein [Chitinophagaceae bacterium]
MHTGKEQFHTLMIPLHSYLQLSREAYSTYLSGKIFSNAETLWLANRKVHEHLLDNTGYIPAELQDDTLILLRHYDGWFAQFHEHMMKWKPSPGDEFIFHRTGDQSAFPIAAEERILAYYEKLKQQIESEVLLKK